MAQESGYETWVVRAFGPDEGPALPGVRYSRERPRDLLERLGLDAWTSFIGASHDTDTDLPAAAFALRNGTNYAGILGAESHRNRRVDEMLRLGVEPPLLDRFRTPIGNRKLGRSPWQVAVGVVAELMEMSG